jgi:hypothetical protein
MLHVPKLTKWWRTALTWTSSMPATAAATRSPSWSASARSI